MAECSTLYRGAVPITSSHISPMCPRELYGQHQSPTPWTEHPPPYSQIPARYTCEMGYPLEGYFGVKTEPSNSYNGISTPPIRPTPRRVRKLPPNLNLTPTTLHKDEFQDSPYHFIPVHPNISDRVTLSSLPCAGAAHKKIQCNCCGSESCDENKSDQERPRTDIPLHRPPRLIVGSTSRESLASTHRPISCNFQRSVTPKIRNDGGSRRGGLEANSFSSHQSAFIPCPPPALGHGLSPGMGFAWGGARHSA